MTKLERQAQRFLRGEINKYEYYESTKWYTAQQVADAIRADVGVVRMRRRDLRRM